MTSTAVQIPGYVAGTWKIDPVHSEVSFLARHMMVSKVRGRFEKYDVELVTAEDPLQSTVKATIDLNSIDTKQEQRDNHIRSADFFEVDTHPQLTYRSTGIRPDGDDFILDGELTIKGVTKPVSLKLEVNGFAADPYGGYRSGFTATGEINRSDFNVNFGLAEGGGLVVADKVQIALDIEAILNQPEK